MLCAIAKRASCPGADNHGREHLPVTSAPLSAACSPDGVLLAFGAPLAPNLCPVPEQVWLKQPKPSPIPLTDSTFQDLPVTTSTATSTVTSATLAPKPVTLGGVPTVPCTDSCNGSTPPTASSGSVSGGGQLRLTSMRDVGQRCPSPEGAVAEELPVSGRHQDNGTPRAPHPGRRPLRPDVSVLSHLIDGERDADAGDVKWEGVREFVEACVEDVVCISTKAAKKSYAACTPALGREVAAMVSEDTLLTTGAMAAAATAAAAAGVDSSADRNLGVTAAPAPAPMLLHGRFLPYIPYIQRASLFTKIPDYEPEQITPGFEQRLALLVAALGGGGGGSSSSRRLGWVYIRPGCVELLLEEEEWGTSSSHGSEGEGPEEEVAQRQQQQQQQPEVRLDANETPSALREAASTEGDASGSSWHAAAYPCRSVSPLTPGPCTVEPFRGSDDATASPSCRSRNRSSGSSSLSSMEFAAIIQALQLRDERDLVVSVEAEEEMEEQEEGEVAGDDGVHGEEDPCRAQYERSESVAPAAGQPQTAHWCRTTIVEPHAHRTPFFLGSEGERQTGIRVAALQPRVLLIPTATAMTAVDEGSMGSLESAHQPTLPSMQVVPSVTWSLHDDGMASQPRLQSRSHGRQARRRSRGGSQPQALPPQPDAQITMRGDPWDTIQVLSLHPAGSSHVQSGSSEQGNGAHPSGTGHIVQRNGGANGGSGAAAAAASLRAAVYCPAAITAEGPSGLELLLRSHGRYLPLRARWRVSEGATPEVLQSPLLLPAAVESSGGHGGGAEDSDGDAVGAMAVPQLIYSTQQRILGPAEGAVPQAVPDAMVGPDVNHLQLLDLDLMELPRRPGIALVDFRWRERPCRAVPLVLTTNPAVATELQAAVSGWSRPQAELDELLLDYGTWEFHVSGAVQWPRCSSSSSVPSCVSSPHLAPIIAFTNSPTPAPALSLSTLANSTSETTAAATLPANVSPTMDRTSSGSSGSSSGSPLHLSTSRLMDLSAHLLRYVSACGWVHTAEHMQRQLDCLNMVTASMTTATAMRAAPFRVTAWEAANSSASPTRLGDVIDASDADSGEGDDAEALRTLAPRGPATSEGCSSASATAWESEECETAVEDVQECKPEVIFGASSGPDEPVACGGGSGGSGSGGGGHGNMVQRDIHRRRDGNGGGRDDSGGCGGRRALWTSDIILPALGLGSISPTTERAFAGYADPWICKLSPVLLFLDMSSLFELLLRERHNLFTTSSATVLVSCSASFAVVLAWLVLPYITWLRLLRASRYIRIATYCTAKGLIAVSGFATPQGGQSYIHGWSLLLMEGVILPAASMLSPSGAVVALSLLAVLTAKMRVVVAAVDVYGAALYGMATVALGLITTAGCQIYLRYLFSLNWWRQQHLEQWPGQWRIVGCGIPGAVTATALH
ncbi:hypothetical protein VaNZ11_003305 [Volvox africanus]|uniref:Transmembrane protein n=1 Tax=Volvox africanus TaxID=51714 RepID=A0ABQ5RU27_9CHLO|nr:hypothetical protein VaNZ11_003305 [Volvox africanus]